MRRSQWIAAAFAVSVLIVLCVLGVWLHARGRALPLPAREQLFPGVEYVRKVQVRPRPMVTHVVSIDMRTPGLRFLVTPADDRGSDLPLRARPTTEFLDEFDVQIAINGDGFSPWWSRSPADYYPHAGDPVRPRGRAASRGRVYWWTSEALPTLYLNSRNRLSFDAPAKPYNAVSGESMLVMGGEALPDLDSAELHPRTAIGYSRNGRYLFLVVVDGRQPLYSDGITLAELAGLMISLGAQYAMNLDGGGSSTLVVEGDNGEPRILNSPIDNYIPGRERPVANHLGISVRR
ncbi:MAG: phosphodiester glycosidase family protein [Chloroflexota bacterium]